MRYPLTCGPDDPALEFVEAINAAFYTGYMLALCSSKEEYGRLTVADRIAIMFAAKAKAGRVL